MGAAPAFQHYSRCRTQNVNFNIDPRGENTIKQSSESGYAQHRISRIKEPTVTRRSLKMLELNHPPHEPLLDNLHPGTRDQTAQGRTCEVAEGVLRLDAGAALADPAMPYEVHTTSLELLSRD